MKRIILFFKKLFSRKNAQVREEEKIRLALVVGHTKKRKGAYAIAPISASEYDFNREFALLIQKAAVRSGLICEVFLRDRVGIRGAYKKALRFKPSAIMELHFNAFNGRASGCEVLTAGNKSPSYRIEEKLAKDLSEKISELLNIPNRGVKYRASNGERGFYNLSQTTDIPSILIEPFFGDNRKDAQAANENKHRMAQILADCVKSALV